MTQILLYTKLRVFAIKNTKPCAFFFVKILFWEHLVDKFGIFELLDTLAQITAETQEDEKSQPQAPVLQPSPEDKSFLPPDWNGDASPEKQKMQRDALNSLYERHESISKRIDKNK